MSFVKLPRKYPNKPQHGSRTGKGKKKKPAWDDTVNDLSVHRASAEELMRRKVVATSHNLDAVKEEQMRQRIGKARQANSRSTPSQNAFLKEVLYDNAQLHEVLAKSDKMMAVVKDLFGDDPMKYRGAPNVTLAPEHSSINGSLPNMELGPSKLDVLSESVMDKTALNEEDEDAEETQEVQYESAMDYGRFQRLLELASEEERRLDSRKAADTGALTRSTADALLHQLASRLGLGPDDEQDGGFEEEVISPQLGKDNNAINDTIKVKKTKSRLTDEERAASPVFEMPASNESSNMSDLRKVLDGLESNICEYEKMIGRQPTVTPSSDNSLSGFTSRLVNAVNKITRYMRENEVRLRAETTLREQLHQDVLFLRQYVDTLTNDILVTQEQYIGLQSEFAKYRKQTAEEILNIKQSLESAGIQLHKTVMPIPQLPQPAFPTVQPEIPTTSQQLASLQQSMNQGIIHQSQPSLTREQMHSELQQQGFKQAVLLSNSSALFNHEPIHQSFIQHQPTLHTEEDYRNREQMAVSSAASMNKLSANPLSAVPVRNTSNAVPLHVPQQSQSPKLPEKRTSASAANPNIPLHPQPMFPATRVGQPVFSKEPMRATSFRPSHAGSHTDVIDTPQEKLAHTSSSDIRVSELPHPVSVHNMQGDVLELKQAIDKEELSLEQQILALQKQHEEAQNKLHHLMQQGQAVDQKTAAMKRMPVSPPISPITVSSESEGRTQTGQKSSTVNPNGVTITNAVPHINGQQGYGLIQTKEIKVSLPRVDMNLSEE